MKKLLLILAAVVGLSGCVVYDTEPVMAGPDHWRYGCVEYCDDEGYCRDVCDTYYYYGPGGAVYYYDAAFGFWIGPHGYWHRGMWVHGWPEGYREHYRGFYHGYNGYRGYHGGYHGGGHR